MADHQFFRLIQLLLSAGGASVSFCTAVEATLDYRWMRKMQLNGSMRIMARLLAENEWMRYLIQALLVLSGIAVTFGYFSESDSRALMMTAISALLFVQTFSVRIARRLIDKGA